MRRALPVAALASLAAGVLALPGAAGATVTVGAYPSTGETRGGIYVRGDAGGSRMTIRYEAATDEFVISDRVRDLRARTRGGRVEPCYGGAHLVRCPNPVGSELAAVMTVRLRRGDDVLRPAGSTKAAVAASGGPGTDMVMGAGGDDVILGGAGPDELRGRGGGDHLEGRAGDSLFGGDGEDLLLADFGSRESVISCGSGSADRAFVDPGDVTPIGCEDIR